MLKHIKPYSFFKINESQQSLVLYHGSPYIFKSFKDRTSFFAETPKFAIQYAETKSMDFGMDNSPNLYKVQFNGNIFDISDTNDYKKLEAVLPDEVSYMYNNFGFRTNISKEEYLLRLKGYHTYTPEKDFINAKIGDLIPNPEYAPEKYKVIKVEDDVVYAYLTYRLDNAISDFFSYSHKEPYKPVYEYIKSYIENTTNKKYVSDDTISKYLNGFKHKNKYTGTEIEQKYLDEFDLIYQKFQNEIIDDITEKISIKTEVLPIGDTWRYYENGQTEDLIKKLGYDGYIAIEEGVKTYCIFHPNKSIEILDLKKY